MRGMTLSHRLAVLVLAGVIPLLGFNLATIYFDFQSDRTRAIGQTLALSRTLSQSTERFLNARIAELKVLADSPDLRTGNLTAFRAEAERAVAYRYPKGGIVLLRRDGEELLDTGLPSDVRLPRSVQLVSLQQAFDTGRPAVSGVFAAAGENRQVVAIDVPVHGADGTVAQILALYLPLETFAPLIERQNPNAEWLSAIIDQNGIRVARVPAENLIGRPATPDVIGRLSGQPEATFEVDIAGRIACIRGLQPHARFWLDNVCRCLDHAVDRAGLVVGIVIGRGGSHPSRAGTCSRASDRARHHRPDRHAVSYRRRTGRRAVAADADRHGPA